MEQKFLIIATSYMTTKIKEFMHHTKNFLSNPKKNENIILYKQLLCIMHNQLVQAMYLAKENFQNEVTPGQISNIIDGGSCQKKLSQ